MTTEAELMQKLAEWLAARCSKATLMDAIETGDSELIGAYVLIGFRQAAAEAVAGHERAGRITAAAVDTFGGDGRRADEFLRSPHIALGGRKPLLEAVASDGGLAAVMQLLADIASRP